MIFLAVAIAFAAGVFVGIFLAIYWVNGRVTKHEHMLHSARGGPKPPERRGR